MAHRSTSDSTPTTPAPVPSPLKGRMEYERGSAAVNGKVDSNEVRLLFFWGELLVEEGRGGLGESQRWSP